MSQLKIILLMLFLVSCSTSRPQDKAFLKSIGWANEDVNKEDKPIKVKEKTREYKEEKYLVAERDSSVFCVSEEVALDNQYKILSSKRFFIEGDCEKSDELRKYIKNDIILKKKKVNATLNSRVNKIKKFISENPNYKDFEDTAIRRKISIGMPEELLVLSWGAPNSINETVNSSGVSKQYVYENNYVYTDDGIVTTYQSF